MYIKGGNVSGGFIKNVLPSNKIIHRHHHFNPNRRSKSHIQKENWTNNNDTVVTNKICRNDSYIKEINRMKNNN